MQQKVLELLALVLLVLLLSHLLDFSTALQLHIFLGLLVEFKLQSLDTTQQIVYLLLIVVRLFVFRYHTFVEFIDLNAQSLILPTHLLHFGVLSLKRIIPIHSNLIDSNV